MIKAVLLDLDNTLLVNPDAIFAREYIQCLETFFQQAIGYSGASRVIRQMMGALTAPRTGIDTNLAVSLNVFSEATGQTPDDLNAIFDRFYVECYPTLRALVQPVAGAADLIHRLRATGVKIAIATNPIYPAAAIQQRMRWANLPDDPALYAFISTADNMHFTKPSPAYYAEILAWLGVEPDEALVIGDSVKNDIRPARQIGMHTFHVVNDAPVAPEADGGGTLEDATKLISASNWRHKFEPKHLAPDLIEPQYHGSIGALYGILADVPRTYWHQHPFPGEWSILQLLCHLVDAESRIQRHRLERILHEVNPFIVEPQPPGPDISVCDENALNIVQKFVAERQATLDFLHTLQPEDWSCPARHSIFGLTTLLEMAHFTAQHDRLHLTQLRQTIDGCHD